MKLKKGLLEKYENKWVALSPDGKAILASSSDVKKLHDKLVKMRVAHGDAIMHFVRPFDAVYAPTWHLG
jgi:hypothetical protein